MRLFLALLAAVALVGCGSDSESDASGSADDPPATIEAPAGAPAAQRAAAEAQSPATGDAAAADPDAAPDAVRTALDAAGIAVDEEQTPEYTTFTLATTDADGEPLPGADAAERKWSPFTLYVGADGKRIADLTDPGDVIPSADPDEQGIVWFEETDPIGDKRYTAYAFHAGGRIVVTTLGDGRKALPAGFKRLQDVLSAFD